MQLDIELAYFEAAVQHFNHYTSETRPVEYDICSQCP